MLISLPKPILARGGEIFVLLAGRPNNETYSKELSGLQTAMHEAGGQFSLSGGLKKNRRGLYTAISAGITHGGGSKVGPVPLHIEGC